MMGWDFPFSDETVILFFLRLRQNLYKNTVYVSRKALGECPLSHVSSKASAQLTISGHCLTHRS